MTCHGVVGKPLAHEGAALHVTGEARYTDDVVEPRGVLHAAVGLSERPHAQIRNINLDEVRSAPGVMAVITASDIPGHNSCGPVLTDDPILAPGLVQYAGQALFAVAAETVDAARDAVLLARVDYDERAAILTAREAVRADSFVLPSERLARGDSTAALAKATHRLVGETRVGGQDQFYLEGQVALAVPREGGELHVLSSTQHPGEVQHLVAEALGRDAHEVVVECRRMGGAFGGKESQAALIACIAALLANATGRAVKLRLDRDTDMVMTGKRHDFDIDYAVGFDDAGAIEALELTYAARCGMSADLSGPINDRAMFHSDNAYYLANVAITSHRCKTHTVSNTAFRGFGGPQGMFAIEYVIDEVARALDIDPLDVRLRNLYGDGERALTPYGQPVESALLRTLIERLEQTSGYRQRRAAIRAENAKSTLFKKGIALTPVKFGISFTATHLNQAGALVHVYKDGSIYLNHGGTEMGQGLYTKVAQVVADELGVPVARVKVSAADTSKVPNASATAASSGSDLNAMAARAAAGTIRERLVDFAAQHFGVAKERIAFAAGQVTAGEARVSFDALVDLAYMARVSLSSTGFYRTPKIHYDRATFSGRPFFYFACGAAVSEVVIDTLTGEYRVTRVDIVHDCGRSLNPALDRGQIEGGFIQGMGWLTSEELVWNGRGALTTHAPSTYKIPTGTDLPHDFRVEMYDGAPNAEATIHRSKAVGEPPLMLALSVFHAIKDAVAGTADYRCSPTLPAPATPEAVLLSLEALRAQAARSSEAHEHETA